MNEVALSSGFLFPSVKISFFLRTARLTSLEPKARKKNQSPFLVIAFLCKYFRESIFH